MKTNTTMTDRTLLGRGSYLSPRTTVTEISAEGVLCASKLNGRLSVETWETGDFEW